MPGAGARFLFGPFVLDEDNAELLKDGVRVKLAPQPFEVLRALVVRPGTLVTREELQALLWGDNGFVDFKAGLNFCMAQLRAALDDSAAASRYIATVPKRGYKFVAPVEMVCRSSDAGTPDRAANRRIDTILFAGVHPALAPLRPEPRFVRVLQRVGL